MNEPQVHAIPEQVSGVMKSLEQCQSHVSVLGTNVADFQKAIQGLDTTVRLIVDAFRATVADQEHVHSEEGQATANAAPAPYEPESWFEPLWRGAVAKVNFQIAAVARGEAPSSVAPSAAQVVTRFRAERLQPLHDLLGPLNHKLRIAAGDPELKPTLDRYLALKPAVDRLNRQVAELEGEHGTEHLWSGELAAVNLQPESFVRQVERDGKLIPQIDFSALREIEVEVNRQIAERCAVAPPEDLPASAAPARLAKLESEFMELLEKLVDLKHSLAEAQARKDQAGQPTDRIREPLKLLVHKLRELDVDEIEIVPGDRVNSRLHKVVSREPHPKLGPGEVIRVVVAGYRYRSELKRMAQVVATP